MLAAIERALTFKRAAALAPNGDRPKPADSCASASRLATAEADSDRFALAAALAEAEAFAAAVAARLRRVAPAAADCSGPSKSINIASGKFFSRWAKAANWAMHMQLITHS